MAADREVIKEFLASLGFQVEEVGLKKFTGALLNVTKLSGKTSASLLGIVVAAEAMVQGFTNRMERFYYASKRTKASVANLQAFEYAAKQVGLSSEDAQGAIEGFAKSLRMQPGLMGLLKNLGIKAEGRDSVVVLNELVQRLSKMPHYVGAQFAEMFGMDERTFLMMKEFLPLFIKSQEERRRMGQAAGVDADAAAKAAVEYNRVLGQLWAQIGLVTDRLAIDLLPAFKKLMDYVNETVMPWALEFSGALGHMADDLSNFGSLDIDFGDVPDVVKSILSAMLQIKDLVVKTWNGEGTAGGIFNFIKTQALGTVGALAKLAEGMALFAKGEYSAAAAKFAEVPWLPTGSPSGPGMAKEAGKATQFRFGKIGPGAPTAAPVAPGARGSLPLGLSQNNPGNLRAWGNAAVRNGFAMFNTKQEGLSAMAGNLLAYSKQGVNSVRGIISKWAPASENNTGAYIDTVTKSMGVRPDEKLNLQDPAVLAKLMDSMIRVEQGRQPFGTAELLAAAQSRLSAEPGAPGAASVVINQKTDIHVDGAGNPQAAARGVFDGQTRVNSNIARQVASAVQ